MNETHPSIEAIVDYLHGELSPAEDAAMHAHLAGCPECEGRRADELAITEALVAHARAQEREVPAGLTTRVLNAAQQRSRHPERSRGAWERLRAVFRPIVVVPAGAVVAVAVYLGYDAWHRAAPAAIEAAYYVNNHAAMAASAPFGDAAPPVNMASDDESR